MRLEMIPREGWPRDVELAPLAQVALTPVELAGKAGIKFHRIEDDLGSLDVAFVKIPSEEVFVFERHVLSPADGTSVSIDASRLTRTTLQRLITALDLDPEEITWVSPSLSEGRDECLRNAPMNATEEQSNAGDDIETEDVAPALRVPKVVYILHGRNVGLKNQVARFLERATQAPAVILHEQTNPGTDVIEKLEEYVASAAYIVVLLTNDDKVNLVGTSSFGTHVRPNVIFELGFFLGSLGRSRVRVLYEEGVELQSNLIGVPITLLDSSGAWKLTLATELRALGLVS